MVGGNANYLDLTSFVAHGMRSLDNSCLFNGDNDDMEILSKAESVISDASTNLHFGVYIHHHHHYRILL